MKALELLERLRSEDPHRSLHIGAFLDEFRAADKEKRVEMVRNGPQECGGPEGLVAAIVSSLCHESGTEAPEWVARVGSREPYFPVPARSFELRLRLMIESPPRFKVRRVFVPENFLSRA